MTGLKEKKALVLLFFIVFSIFTFSSAYISCNIVTTGTCTGTDVLHMYKRANSHAELPNQTNARYSVCCEDVSPYTVGYYTETCDQAVLANLRTKTNTHVQQTNETGYPYKICLGATDAVITCNYRQNNCEAEEECVFSINTGARGYTNAHIGDCTTNPYPTQVCCSIHYTATNMVVSSLSPEKDNDTVDMTTDTFYCVAGAGNKKLTSISLFHNKNGDMSLVDAEAVNGQTDSATWDIKDTGIGGNTTYFDGGVTYGCRATNNESFSIFVDENYTFSSWGNGTHFNTEGNLNLTLKGTYLSGSYYSQIFDYGYRVNWTNMRWLSYPGSGTINLYVKTADAMDEWTLWEEITTSPSGGLNNSARYFQYRADFNRPNTNVFPYLRWVELDFTPIDWAPTKPLLAVDDTTVQTNDVITCTASGSTDENSDIITYMYLFNKTDGTLVQDWSTTNTLDCGIENCHVFDTLNCWAKAATETRNSSAVKSALITIENTPPSKPSTLLPLSGAFGSQHIPIVCNGSTDDDNHGVTYTIAGQLDGDWTNLEIQGDGLYSWDVSSYTDQSTSLHCAAWDGYDYSLIYYLPGSLIIDNSDPTITLDAPANNSILLSNNIINFTVDGTTSSLSTVYWSLNNGVNRTDFISSYDISSENWPQGTNKITIWVQDAAQNSWQKTVYFYKDTVGPIIALTTPAHLSFSTKNPFSLCFTVEHPLSPLMSCTLYIDNTAMNSSIVANATEHCFSVNANYESTIAWKVQCEETYQSAQSLQRSVIVDNVNPQLNEQATLPSPQSTQFNGTVYFNLTCEDGSTKSVYLEANFNGTYENVTLGLNSADNHFSYPVNWLTQGYYGWRFYCVDAFDNSQVTQQHYYAVTDDDITITLSSPVNGSEYEQTVSFNYIVDRPNVTIFYSLNNEANQTLSDNSSTMFTNVVGVNTLSLWAIDYANVTGHKKLSWGAVWCGDTVCSETESCSSCPTDCGTCSSGDSGGSSGGGGRSSGRGGGGAPPPRLPPDPLSVNIECTGVSFSIHNPKEIHCNFIPDNEYRLDEPVEIMVISLDSKLQISPEKVIIEDFYILEEISKNTFVQTAVKRDISFKLVYVGFLCGTTKTKVNITAGDISYYEVPVTISAPPCAASPTPALPGLIPSASPGVMYSPTPLISVTPEATPIITPTKSPLPAESPEVTTPEIPQVTQQPLFENNLDKPLPEPEPEPEPIENIMSTLKQSHSVTGSTVLLPDKTDSDRALEKITRKNIAVFSQKAQLGVIDVQASLFEDMEQNLHRQENITDFVLDMISKRRIETYNITIDDKTEIITMITLYLTIDNKQGLENITIIETIPKTIAEDVDDIYFEILPTRIIERDPVVLFSFPSDNVPDKITYSVKKEVNVTAVQQEYEAPQLFAQKVSVVAASSSRPYIYHYIVIGLLIIVTLLGVMSRRRYGIAITKEVSLFSGIKDLEKSIGTLKSDALLLYVVSAEPGLDKVIAQQWLSANKKAGFESTALSLHNFEHAKNLSYLSWLEPFLSREKASKIKKVYGKTPSELLLNSFNKEINLYLNDLNSRKNPPYAFSSIKAALYTDIMLFAGHTFSDNDFNKMFSQLIARIKGHVAGLITIDEHAFSKLNADLSTEFDAIIFINGAGHVAQVLAPVPESGIDIIQILIDWSEKTVCVNENDKKQPDLLYSPPQDLDSLSLGDPILDGAAGYLAPKSNILVVESGNKIENYQARANLIKKLLLSNALSFNPYVAFNDNLFPGQLEINNWFTLPKKSIFLDADKQQTALPGHAFSQISKELKHISITSKSNNDNPIMLVTDVISQVYIHLERSQQVPFIKKLLTYLENNNVGSFFFISQEEFQTLSTHPLLASLMKHIMYVDYENDTIKLNLHNHKYDSTPLYMPLKSSLLTPHVSFYNKDDLKQNQHHLIDNLLYKMGQGDYSEVVKTLYSLDPHLHPLNIVLHLIKTIDETWSVAHRYWLYSYALLHYSDQLTDKAKITLQCEYSAASLAMQHYDEAKELLSEIRVKDPNNIDAQLVQSEYLYAVGKEKESMTLLKELSQQDMPTKYLKQILAIYAKMMKFNDALKIALIISKKNEADTDVFAIATTVIKNMPVSEKKRQTLEKMLAMYTSTQKTRQTYDKTLPNVSLPVQDVIESVLDMYLVALETDVGVARYLAHHFIMHYPIIKPCFVALAKQQVEKGNIEDAHYIAKHSTEIMPYNAVLLHLFSTMEYDSGKKKQSLLVLEQCAYALQQEMYISVLLKHNFVTLPYGEIILDIATHAYELDTEHIERVLTLVESFSFQTKHKSLLYWLAALYAKKGDVNMEESVIFTLVETYPDDKEMLHYYLYKSEGEQEGEFDQKQLINKNGKTL